MGENGDLDEMAHWRLGDHMTHSYYLDTLNDVRPTFQALSDIVLAVVIMVCVMGGLMLLRDKGYLHNYHWTWQPENEPFTQ